MKTRKVFEVSLGKTRGFFAEKQGAIQVSEFWNKEGKGIWKVKEVVVDEKEFVNQ